MHKTSELLFGNNTRCAARGFQNDYLCDTIARLPLVQCPTARGTPAMVKPAPRHNKSRNTSNQVTFKIYIKTDELSEGTTAIEVPHDQQVITISCILYFDLSNINS